MLARQDWRRVHHSRAEAQLTRGPWTSSPLAAIGSRQVVAQADWTRYQMERLGVRVPGGCRLLNARKLLDDLNRDAARLVGASDDFLIRVAEANRTLSEYYTIMYAALCRNGCRFLRRPEILQGAIGGADVAAEDRNPQARNTQFELYAAASLGLASADLRWGEPDFLLNFCGEYVGVAAKRMSSASHNALRDQVTDAAKQIAKHGPRGFIAINIDVHYIGTELPQNDAERFTAFDKRTDLVLGAAHQELRQRREVMGVLIFGYAQTWLRIGDKLGYDVAYPSSFLMLETDGDDPKVKEKGIEYFNALFPRLRAGIEELRRGAGCQ